MYLERFMQESLYKVFRQVTLLYSETAETILFCICRPDRLKNLYEFAYFINEHYDQKINMNILNERFFPELVRQPPKVDK